jgi:hypothetical protein
MASSKRRVRDPPSHMRSLQHANGNAVRTVGIFVSYSDCVALDYRNRGSSVGIVSDYGLDDREIRVRSPAGEEDFSSILCVQTGSGAHPVSCPMGTGGPFPSGKAQPGRDADH